MNRPAAFRVGAFTLAGLALLAAAVLWVSRDWFGATEAVQLHFAGSVYGLQPGAPVVVRGVRVGRVESVGLAPLAASGGTPQVPVRALVERAAVAPLLGPAAAADGQPVLPRLVARGLYARLQSQSLLTGLLYLELDIDPALAATAAAPPRAPDGAVEVPTRMSGLEALQQRLAGVDVEKLGADVAATVAGVRRMVEAPGAADTLARAASAAAAIEGTAARLGRDAERVAARADALLAEARASLAAITPPAVQAAQGVAAAASQAARSAAALEADGRETLAALRSAAGSLERAGGELAALAAADGPVADDGRRALAEVARAARSLRELAELLESHPDALLRGRAPPPAPER